MLEHKEIAPFTPNRALVLGANGFIGRALVSRLRFEGVETLGFCSAELDLTSPLSVEKLAGQLLPSDTVIVLSALTPDRGRDIDTFMRNLAIGRNVCKALEAKPVRHVVYMSSDAVYPFGNKPVTEASPISSDAYYGMMHIVRELMFRKLPGSVMSTLRCSSVYGGADSHNSYGPNRFRREAAHTGRITLGGNGEETRDHIHIDDVVTLTWLVITHRCQGTLNLATGDSTPFLDVARQVAAHFDPEPEIVTTPRTFEITHRVFDVTALSAAFPGFHNISLKTGLAQAHQQEFGQMAMTRPL